MFASHYREFLVDLIGKPGSLHKPDSLLNGPSSISISSPLRFPRYRQVGPTVDFRSLARQYFSDCQSLDHLFEDSSAGNIFFYYAFKLICMQTPRNVKYTPFTVYYLSHYRSQGLLIILFIHMVVLVYSICYYANYYLYRGHRTVGIYMAVNYS